MNPRKKHPGPRDPGLDFEECECSRRSGALREKLITPRRLELFMNARDYYLAKRGEL